MIDRNKKAQNIIDAAAAKAELLRSVACAVSCDLAESIAAEMEEAGFDLPRADIDYSVSYVDVTTTLTEGLSLKDVKPFLKRVAATRLYEPATYHPAAESGLVHWSFRGKDDIMTLKIFVWLGNSVTCRRVPTGHMVEEYKVVCDDMPEVEVD